MHRPPTSEFRFPAILMRDVSPREQWTDCEASRKEVVEGEMRPVTMRDSRLHYNALFNVQNEKHGRSE